MLKIPPKRQFILFLICFSVPFSITIPLNHYAIYQEYDKCLSDKSVDVCSVIINWDGYYGFIIGAYVFLSLILAMIVPSLLPDTITGKTLTNKRMD